MVQSNAPFPEEPAANGPLRINSGLYHARALPCHVNVGFYRVRSNPATIFAMEEIVTHAATSTMTEQPSFYYVLCGGRDGTNKVGSNRCHYEASGAPNNIVDVLFLDREFYPNGHVNSYWEAYNITKAHPQLIVLHNNWIKGLRAKIERLVDHKLWFFDRQKEICDYSPSPLFVFDWSVDDVEE